MCLELRPGPKATLIKPGNDNPTTWFKEWLEGGGDVYLKQDIRTEKGLAYIVKYNDLQEEWNKTDASKLSTDERIALLKRMITETKMKHDLYFSAVEGMHRTQAAECILTKSAPDHMTGRIRPGSLTIRKFKEVLHAEEYPTDKKFRAVFKDSTQPGTDKEPHMLDDEFNIRIHYVTNPEANMDDVVQALKTRSETISADKLKSARPSAVNKIASYGLEMIKSISADAIEHQPQCNNLTAKPTRKQKVNTPKIIFLQNITSNTLHLTHTSINFYILPIHVAIMQHSTGKTTPAKKINYL